MPTIRDTSVNKLDLITTPIVDVDITAVSNNVEIENKASSAVITDIKKGTFVNVGVPVKQNIIITGQSIQGSTGPAGLQGPQGPVGPAGPVRPFIATGSISASVNIGTNIFFVNSGNQTFLNLTNQGSFTVASSAQNVFLIKNVNTNAAILTVSQSGIVKFATQSNNPIGSTTAGSIYFTSSSLFIGLE
jgi:hypothetical protein